MKKRIITIACAAILLLVSITCFFKFTTYGQDILYDVFGGNDFYLTSDNKELYWFDVAHRNNPNAPIFKRIENLLVKFNPDLVLVEGGADTFEGSRDEAIYDGESAFAAYLAKNNAITVENIEPPFTKQVEYLQSKYTADEILAMYLIRQISSMQFASDNSMWDFDQEVLNQTQFLIDSGLTYSGKTLEDILITVNVFLPESVDGNNWRDVDIRKMNYVYTREDGALYPVYNDVTNFRNIYLVELLKEKKDTYDRIFIVMGGGHLVETKEQLVDLYLY